MTEADKIANARLWRTYGITLDDYAEMLKRGNGGCWICGKPPKPGKRLHVDHLHAVRYYKIETEKRATDRLWVAFMPALNLVAVNTKRNPAIRDVRQQAKRKATRGLLCWRCNAGLRSWSDNSELMLSASKYISSYNTEGNKLG